MVCGLEEPRAPGECLVKIDATGCCHTDLRAASGDWPLKAKSPLIGGHEGVGIIVAIGSNTAHFPVKIGDRVGIKWLADSCLNCGVSNGQTRRSGRATSTAINRHNTAAMSNTDDDSLPADRATMHSGVRQLI
ncbi:hypothetical protein BDZ89DRAFT_467261 [Hymenopellis radicata]|nr:hypothetical protein BDZ89DRAFT_467261 [Hymenopellis radicata]